jgi:hypothetical protein
VEQETPAGKSRQARRRVGDTTAKPFGGISGSAVASRKIQHAVDKAVYALRNRIEGFFNRAKKSRRVATSRPDVNRFRFNQQRTRSN